MRYIDKPEKTYRYIVRSDADDKLHLTGEIRARSQGEARDVLIRHFIPVEANQIWIEFTELRRKP